ncbi:MAG TPA: amidohydrolase family protein [Acidimicrobiales bacterium]|jgi:N-acyl-D-aspartate/D-glutamate deacylase|nr:amidohydrolase family protein [Acidimicrobiales bacterium]
MSFDLVIRGGTVVDGSGGPARTADVAISNGRIAEVGSVEGKGQREIDADGALVTPGFVDIHTHYDGQATWDTRLQPSSLHGVTTVVSGNCGVGFAPVRPGDHGALVELMEGVEDLPGTVLNEGLSWEWESIGEYLNALERRQFDIDVAAQVCHAPVRLFVMGQRGADREAASEEEIAEMGRLAAEGIRAGALGFTTSRTLNHRTSRGEPTPTLTASRDELVGIARAIGATGQGVLQVVSDFTDQSEGETLLEMMRASGRPLSISLLQSSAGVGYRKRLALLDAAQEEGLTMRAQVAARAVGVLLGLQGSINPLRHTPSFQAVAGAPLAEQARRLGQPDAREQLVREVSDVGLPFSLDRIFDLGAPPDYEPGPEDSIEARARRAGMDPHALYVDLLLGDEGRALLYLPFLNYFDGNLNAAAEMMAHPQTVPGLSDGGAHVGTICDASFPTSLLTHWGRDRKSGTMFSVPSLIARQSRSTAEAVGLLDRGLLAPGYKADVNVIDFEHLGVTAPAMHHDLPAGGKRLMQGAQGYLHTIVSGTETYADGVATGELPGRFVRGPQSDARQEARR